MFMFKDNDYNTIIEKKERDERYAKFLEKITGKGCPENVKKSKKIIVRDKRLIRKKF